MQRMSGMRAERDITTAVHLLRWEGRRLLTLTAPGGMRKTRLAIQIAVAIVADFDSGAHFVALEEIRDADSVPGAIASGLRLREESRSVTVRTSPQVQRLCARSSCQFTAPYGVRVALPETATNMSTWPFSDWKLTSVAGAMRLRIVKGPTTSLRATGVHHTASETYTVASSSGGYGY